MCLSKFKDMPTVVFDIQDVVTAEWVPSRQTINHHYYFGILTKFSSAIEKEIAMVVEKLVEYSSEQSAIPYRFMCTAGICQ